MRTTAPYGTWESPLAAADVIEGLVRYSDLKHDDGHLYWTEMRPAEAGRQVIVRRGPDGKIEDVLMAPWNARTRVHEYGGGSVVAGAGRLAFSEFSDQRLYAVTESAVTPLTPETEQPGALRYADGRFLPDGSIVCVRESHHSDGEPGNEIVRVLPDGEVVVIATGRDFYAAPRPSPDGTRLAWLEWDHPNMPWDGTELTIADLSGDGVASVAGGPEESIFQPEWNPEGSLLFASDRRGWWNLYRYRDGSVEPVVEIDADIGDPAWVFGRTSFGFLSEARILIGYWEDGVHRLAVVGPAGDLTPLPDELASHEGLITDGVSKAWFVGAGGTTPTTIFELDVDSGERLAVRANVSPVPPEYVPEPRVITFPTVGDAVAHGVFYPPTNADFGGPEDELAPLIVQVHGGPTSHVYPRLAPGFLFWTSRGFAVVDVNYRGSTGYGREFRNQLRDNWGICDVEDCAAAARYLASEGLVDGDRLIITGGSAGGYTTLAALAFDDVFAAGASYYGVADIELLNAHTHKFESRYLDGLVGTDPEVIRVRSPLYSCDQISVPVVLFQGLEDKVVPPEQAEVIADALADAGTPHAHITYEGEDHGFRKAETIIHSLETELAFYGKVFGFTPAGDLPEVPLAAG